MIVPKMTEVVTYPNPFHNNIKFSVKDEKDKISSLEIFNIKGQKIYSEQKFNNEVTWNGKDLKK